MSRIRRFAIQMDVKTSFMVWPLILIGILMGMGPPWVAAEVLVEAMGSNLNSSRDIGSDVGFDLDEEFEEEFNPDRIDILSSYNRLMTHVNDKFYFWVMKPLATCYGIMIPEPGRKAVDRCFKNLLFPGRLINNVLQLKFKAAWTECARFGVNSTLGVLGLGDPASSWFALEPHDEDFGQTLGHYGVNGGSHLVLPLLGPSNLRDAVCLLPESFVNPLSYVSPAGLSLGLKATQRTNYTSLHLGRYETLRKDAFDLYLYLRDGYETKQEDESRALTDEQILGCGSRLDTGLSVCIWG